jgi:hypothetical protein
VVVLTLLLLLFGLLMWFSASFVGAALDGDAFGTFRRQLLWAAIGLPVLWLTSRVPRTVLRRLAWPGLALAVLGLLLVLIPGVGVERFGSSRWVGVGEFYRPRGSGEQRHQVSRRQNLFYFWWPIEGRVQRRERGNRVRDLIGQAKVGRLWRSLSVLGG